MIALVESVEPLLLGSSSLGAASAGDVLLTVDDATDFPVDGGTLRHNNNVYGFEPYEPGEDGDTTETLTLTSALVSDVEDGDPIAVLDTNGKQRETWLAWVTLGDGGNPWSAEISHALIDNLSSDVALLEGEQVIVEDKPEGPRVTSIVNKQAETDGGAIAVATVTANALTTAAAGDDIVNGTFEDWTPYGYTTLFDGWRPSWFEGDIADVYIGQVEGGSQIAGTVSATIVLANDVAALRHMTDRTYPCRGGQVVDVRCVVRADRTVDRSALSDPSVVQLVVHTAIEGRDPDEIFAEPDVIWQYAQTLDHIGTTEQEIGGQVTIPDGHTLMRVSVGARPSGDGSGWTLIHDEVHKSTVADATAPQRLEDVTFGRAAVAGPDDLMIGSQTLMEWALANFTPLPGAFDTATFSTTAIRTYDSTGAEIVSFRDDYAATGYSATVGIRTAAIWFDEGAIQTLLTGKTIDKVEAYIHITARGSSGAGELVLGYHGDATPRATWAAVTGKNTDAVSPRPTFTVAEGKWVTLTHTPAEWVSGAKCGLVFGVAPSSSFLYSMTADGVGKPAGIKLRFTYH